jgi:hypothetical protein
VGGASYRITGLSRCEIALPAVLEPDAPQDYLRTPVEPMAGTNASIVLSADAMCTACAGPTALDTYSE